MNSYTMIILETSFCMTAYMSAVLVEQMTQCTVADQGDMSAANG